MSNPTPQLLDFAKKSLSFNEGDVSMLSGDASFRHYYRVKNNEISHVLVDADPKHEDNHSFVKVAAALQQADVHAPKVLDVDYKQGFMLLNDLGDELMLSHLNQNSASSLYSSAFKELIKIQACQCDVPEYDEQKLQQELSLFDEWFLNKLLNIELNCDEKSLLDAVYKSLIHKALSQPKVLVHRDYHSRNLMLLDDKAIGVLDFQDAVIGPVTYDLVSLLRDCYIDWPDDMVESWVQQFGQMAKEHGIITDLNPDQFKEWFDWMGLQRHLKCLGIFSRLNLRDNKPSYLGDIPRVMRYVLRVCDKYPELTQFKELLLKYEGNDISSGAWQPLATTDGLNS